MPETSAVFDLLIVNPNGSRAITEALVGVAAANLPRLHVGTWTLEDAPSYIETPAQLQLLLGRVADGLRVPGRRAVFTLVGCFSSLERGGRTPELPGVVTLAEACIAVLGLRGLPFSIVTGGSCWQQPVAALVARMGYSHLVRSVRASELNAQQVLAAGPEAVETFRLLIETTAREDAVSSVLLGGGGFIGKTGLFSAGLACELLDCGDVAMKAIGMLWSLRLPVGTVSEASVESAAT
jgi:allantoin racemase